MKFTVIAECEGCDQKFAGTAEHLKDAVSHMVKSLDDADHTGPELSQELDKLSNKAGDVNTMASIMSALGIDPRDHEIQILEPISMKDFKSFLRDKIVEDSDE